MQPQDASPLIQSQTTGATEPPLIEQTIGAFFDAMVQSQPDHEALVSCHQAKKLWIARKGSMIQPKATISAIWNTAVSAYDCKTSFS